MLRPQRADGLSPRPVRTDTLQVSLSPMILRSPRRSEADASYSTDPRAVMSEEEISHYQQMNERVQAQMALKSRQHSKMRGDSASSSSRLSPRKEPRRGDDERVHKTSDGRMKPSPGTRSSITSGSATDRTTGAGDRREDAEDTDAAETPQTHPRRTSLPVFSHVDQERLKNLGEVPEDASFPMKRMSLASTPASPRGIVHSASSSLHALPQGPSGNVSRPLKRPISSTTRSSDHPFPSSSSPPLSEVPLRTNTHTDTPVQPRTRTHHRSSVIHPASTPLRGLSGPSSERAGSITNNQSSNSSGASNNSTGNSNSNSNGNNNSLFATSSDALHTHSARPATVSAAASRTPHTPTVASPRPRGSIASLPRRRTDSSPATPIPHTHTYASGSTHTAHTAHTAHTTRAFTTPTHTPTATPASTAAAPPRAHRPPHPPHADAPSPHRHRSRGYIPRDTPSRTALSQNTPSQTSLPRDAPSQGPLGPRDAQPPALSQRGVVRTLTSHSATDQGLTLRDNLPSSQEPLSYGASIGVQDLTLGETLSQGSLQRNASSQLSARRDNLSRSPRDDIPQGLSDNPSQGALQRAPSSRGHLHRNMSSQGSVQRTNTIQKQVHGITPSQKQEQGSNSSSTVQSLPHSSYHHTHERRRIPPNDTAVSHGSSALASQHVAVSAQRSGDIGVTPLAVTLTAAAMDEEAIATGAEVEPAQTNANDKTITVQTKIEAGTPETNPGVGGSGTLVSEVKVETPPGPFFLPSSSSLPQSSADRWSMSVQAVSVQAGSRQHQQLRASPIQLQQEERHQQRRTSPVQFQLQPHSQQQQPQEQVKGQQSYTQAQIQPPTLAHAEAAAQLQALAQTQVPIHTAAHIRPVTQSYSHPYAHAFPQTSTQHPSLQPPQRQQAQLPLSQSASLHPPVQQEVPPQPYALLHREQLPLQPPPLLPLQTSLQRQTLQQTHSSLHQPAFLQSQTTLHPHLTLQTQPPLHSHTSLPHQLQHHEGVLQQLQQQQPFVQPQIAAQPLTLPLQHHPSLVQPPVNAPRQQFSTPQTHLGPNRQLQPTSSQQQQPPQSQLFSPHTFQTLGLQQAQPHAHPSQDLTVQLIQTLPSQSSQAHASQLSQTFAPQPSQIMVSQSLQTHDSRTSQMHVPQLPASLSTIVPQSLASHVPHARTSHHPPHPQPLPLLQGPSIHLNPHAHADTRAHTQVDAQASTMPQMQARSEELSTLTSTQGQTQMQPSHPTTTPRQLQQRQPQAQTHLSLQTQLPLQSVPLPQLAPSSVQFSPSFLPQTDEPRPILPLPFQQPSQTPQQPSQGALQERPRGQPPALQALPAQPAQTMRKTPQSQPQLPPPSLGPWPQPQVLPLVQDSPLPLVQPLQPQALPSNAQSVELQTQTLQAQADHHPTQQQQQQEQEEHVLRQEPCQEAEEQVKNDVDKDHYYQQHRQHQHTQPQQPPLPLPAAPSPSLHNARQSLPPYHPHLPIPRAPSTPRQHAGASDTRTTPASRQYVTEPAADVPLGMEQHAKALETGGDSIFDMQPYHTSPSPFTTTETAMDTASNNINLIEGLEATPVDVDTKTVDPAIIVSLADAVAVANTGYVLDTSYGASAGEHADTASVVDRMNVTNVSATCVAETTAASSHMISPTVSPNANLNPLAAIEVSAGSLSAPSQAPPASLYITPSTSPPLVPSSALLPVPSPPVLPSPSSSSAIVLPTHIKEPSFPHHPAFDLPAVSVSPGVDRNALSPSPAVLSSLGSDLAVFSSSPLVDRPSLPALPPPTSLTNTATAINANNTSIVGIPFPGSTHPSSFTSSSSTATIASASLLQPHSHPHHANTHANPDVNTVVDASTRAATGLFLWPANPPLPSRTHTPAREVPSHPEDDHSDCASDADHRDRYGASHYYPDLYTPSPPGLQRRFSIPSALASPLHSPPGSPTPFARRCSTSRTSALTSLSTTSLSTAAQAIEASGSVPTHAASAAAIQRLQGELHEQITTSYRLSRELSRANFFLTNIASQTRLKQHYRALLRRSTLVTYARMYRMRTCLARAVLRSGYSLAKVVRAVERMPDVCPGDPRVYVLPDAVTPVPSPRAPQAAAAALTATIPSDVCGVVAVADNNDKDDDNNDNNNENKEDADSGGGLTATTGVDDVGIGRGSAVHNTIADRTAWIHSNTHSSTQSNKHNNAPVSLNTHTVMHTPVTTPVAAVAALSNTTTGTLTTAAAASAAASAAVRSGTGMVVSEAAPITSSTGATVRATIASPPSPTSITPACLQPILLDAAALHDLSSAWARDAVSSLRLRRRRRGEDITDAAAQEALIAYNACREALLRLSSSAPWSQSPTETSMHSVVPASCTKPTRPVVAACSTTSSRYGVSATSTQNTTSTHPTSTPQFISKASTTSAAHMPIHEATMQLAALTGTASTLLGDYAELLSQRLRDTSLALKHAEERNSILTAHIASQAEAHASLRTHCAHLQQQLHAAEHRAVMAEGIARLTDLRAQRRVESEARSASRSAHPGVFGGNGGLRGGTAPLQMPKRPATATTGAATATLTTATTSNTTASPSTTPTAGAGAGAGVNDPTIDAAAAGISTTANSAPRGITDAAPASVVPTGLDTHGTAAAKPSPVASGSSSAVISRGGPVRPATARAHPRRPRAPTTTPTAISTTASDFATAITHPPQVAIDVSHLQPPASPSTASSLLGSTTGASSTLMDSYSPKEVSPPRRNGYNRATSSLYLPAGTHTHSRTQTPTHAHARTPTHARAGHHAHTHAYTQPVSARVPVSGRAPGFSAIVAHVPRPSTATHVHASTTNTAANTATINGTTSAGTRVHPRRPATAHASRPRRRSSTNNGNIDTSHNTSTTITTTSSAPPSSPLSHSVPSAIPLLPASKPTSTSTSIASGPPPPPPSSLTARFAAHTAASHARASAPAEHLYSGTFTAPSGAAPVGALPSSSARVAAAAAVYGTPGYGTAASAGPGGTTGKIGVSAKGRDGPSEGPHAVPQSNIHATLHVSPRARGTPRTSPRWNGYTGPHTSPHARGTPRRPPSSRGAPRMDTHTPSHAHTQADARTPAQDVYPSIATTRTPPAHVAMAVTHTATVHADSNPNTTPIPHSVGNAAAALTTTMDSPSEIQAPAEAIPATETGEASGVCAPSVVANDTCTRDIRAIVPDAGTNTGNEAGRADGDADASAGTSALDVPALRVSPIDDAVNDGGSDAHACSSAHTYTTSDIHAPREPVSYVEDVCSQRPITPIETESVITIPQTTSIEATDAVIATAINAFAVGDGAADTNTDMHTTSSAKTTTVMNADASAVAFANAAENGTHSHIQTHMRTQTPAPTSQHTHTHALPAQPMLPLPLPPLPPPPVPLPPVHISSHSNVSAQPIPTSAVVSAAEGLTLHRYVAPVATLPRDHLSCSSPALSPHPIGASPRTIVASPRIPLPPTPTGPPHAHTNTNTTTATATDANTPGNPVVTSPTAMTTTAARFPAPTDPGAAMAAIPIIAMNINTTTMNTTAAAAADLIAAEVPTRSPSCTHTCVPSHPSSTLPSQPSSNTYSYHRSHTRSRSCTDVTTSASTSALSPCLSAVSITPTPSVVALVPLSPYNSIEMRPSHEMLYSRDSRTVYEALDARHPPQSSDIYNNKLGESSAVSNMRPSQNVRVPTESHSQNPYEARSSQQMRSIRDSQRSLSSVQEGRRASTAEEMSSPHIDTHTRKHGNSNNHKHDNRDSHNTNSNSHRATYPSPYAAAAAAAASAEEQVIASRDDIPYGQRSQRVSPAARSFAALLDAVADDGSDEGIADRHGNYGGDIDGKRGEYQYMEKSPNEEAVVDVNKTQIPAQHCPPQTSPTSIDSCAQPPGCLSTDVDVNAHHQPDPSTQHQLSSGFTAEADIIAESTVGALSADAGSLAESTVGSLLGSLMPSCFADASNTASASSFTFSNTTPVSIAGAPVRSIDTLYAANRGRGVARAAVDTSVTIVDTPGAIAGMPVAIAGVPVVTAVASSTSSTNSYFSRTGRTTTRTAIAGTPVTIDSTPRSIVDTPVAIAGAPVVNLDDSSATGDQSFYPSEKAYYSRPESAYQEDYFPDEMNSEMTPSGSAHVHPSAHAPLITLPQAYSSPSPTHVSLHPSSSHSPHQYQHLPLSLQGHVPVHALALVVPEAPPVPSGIGPGSLFPPPNAARRSRNVSERGAAPVQIPVQVSAATPAAVLAAVDVSPDGAENGRCNNIGNGNGIDYDKDNGDSRSTMAAPTSAIQPSPHSHQQQPQKRQKEAILNHADIVPVPVHDTTVTSATTTIADTANALAVRSLSDRRVANPPRNDSRAHTPRDDDHVGNACHLNNVHGGGSGDIKSGRNVERTAKVSDRSANDVTEDGNVKKNGTMSSSKPSRIPRGNAVALSLTPCQTSASPCTSQPSQSPVASRHQQPHLLPSSFASFPTHTHGHVLMQTPRARTNSTTKGGFTPSPILLSPRSSSHTPVPAATIAMLKPMPMSLFVAAGAAASASAIALGGASPASSTAASACRRSSLELLSYTASGPPSARSPRPPKQGQKSPRPGPGTGTGTPRPAGGNGTPRPMTTNSTGTPRPGVITSADTGTPKPVAISTQGTGYTGKGIL